MQNYTKLIEAVDVSHTDVAKFKRTMVGCIVLTIDRKILLQMRANDRRTFPGCLAMFGGRVEVGEEPMQALIRELNEELGAKVNKSEVISFGSITEAAANYADLVYVYFWHDHLGTITGCYEDAPLYFADVESAIRHPNVMDDVCWLLEQCRSLNLLP